MPDVLTALAEAQCEESSWPVVVVLGMLLATAVAIIWLVKR